MFNAKTIVPLFALAASTLAGCNLDLNELLGNLMDPDQCAASQCTEVTAADCYVSQEVLHCSGDVNQGAECLEFNSQCYSNTGTDSTGGTVDPGMGGAGGIGDACTCEDYYYDEAYDGGFEEKFHEGYDPCFDYCWDEIYDDDDEYDYDEYG